MTTEDNDNDNGKEQEQQQSTVIKADKPSWLMVAGGSLLVALFVVGMVDARGIGNETTETSPVAAGMASSSPAAGDTTTKTTKTKNAPSDTLLTAILASGAALIIVGALYSRISTITLPGGVSIGLTTQETKTTKDADRQRTEGPSDVRSSRRPHSMQ